MSTDPRLRISFTFDVVCGRLGACAAWGSGVSEACCSRSAGRLLACSTARSRAHPQALSFSLSLTLVHAVVLFRSLLSEHLRVLVLSCDRLGFPARHPIASTQAVNNQYNRKSKMFAAFCIINYSIPCIGNYKMNFCLFYQRNFTNIR